MALDRETKALLERLGKDRRLFPETPPTLTDHRRNISSLLSEYAEDPRPVGAVEDLVVAGHEGEALPVRRYLPEAPSAHPKTGLLFIHGGGWSLGDLEGYDSLCRNFCALSGLAVYSVEYRLAPEHVFPAGLEDVTAAFSYLRHDEGLNRIIAMGDSAGGNLAACLALKLVAEQKPGPEALVLIYPMTDVSRNNIYPSRASFGGGNYFLSSDMIESAAKTYVSDEAARNNPLVSPLLVANAGVLPPTLIVTAGYDPLRDEGRAFEEKLRLAGVRTAFLEYETTIHGFLSFGGALPVGRRALVEIVSEMETLLS